MFETQKTEETREAAHETPLAERLSALEERLAAIRHDVEALKRPPASPQKAEPARAAATEKAPVEIPPPITPPPSENTTSMKKETAVRKRRFSFENLKRCVKEKKREIALVAFSIATAAVATYLSSREENAPEQPAIERVLPQAPQKEEVQAKSLPRISTPTVAKAPSYHFWYARKTPPEAASSVPKTVRVPLPLLSQSALKRMPETEATRYLNLWQLIHPGTVPPEEPGGPPLPGH